MLGPERGNVGGRTSAAAPCNTTTHRLSSHTRRVKGVVFSVMKLGDHETRIHTPFQNDNHFDLRPHLDLHKPLMYTATLLASVLLTSPGSQKDTHRRLQTANLTTTTAVMVFPGCHLPLDLEQGRSKSLLQPLVVLAQLRYLHGRTDELVLDPAPSPPHSCHGSVAVCCCCRPELPAESKLGSHSLPVLLAFGEKRYLFSCLLLPWKVRSHQGK